MQASGAPIEIEWQFDAIDLRPVERFIASELAGPRRSGGDDRITASAKAPQRLVDRYLDTEDWRLGRSGHVLRVRTRGRTEQATMKDTSPAVDGLRQRLEVTEPVPAGGLVAKADGGVVTRRLWALAGNRPLVEISVVQTRRRPFEVRLGERVVGELVLDETTVHVGKGEEPVRLRRVELEIDPDCGETVAPLVERLRTECGLQFATLSKLEAGLLASGRKLPSSADLGSTSLPVDPTLGDVAYAAMRRSFAQMLAHEPGTRLGDDPEELHDMRVATRHLRAAIALFGAALPARAQQIRAEVGWLAAVLGAVRDLDVQLEQLEEWATTSDESTREALLELGRLLATDRHRARAELLVALDSARYERLVAGFGTLLRRGPVRQVAGARAQAYEAVPVAIEGLQRAAAKSARRARASGLPADFHRLRIRCKRLRYALEFVSVIYDGKVAAFRKQIVALQTSLGNLQDAEVAGARLREMALSAGGGELSSLAVFVMGACADRYRREAEELLAALPDQVKGVKGFEWETLRALMAERRPAAAGGALALVTEPVAEAVPARARPRRSVAARESDAPAGATASNSRPTAAAPSGATKAARRALPGSGRRATRAARAERSADGAGESGGRPDDGAGAAAEAVPPARPRTRRASPAARTTTRRVGTPARTATSRGGAAPTPPAWRAQRRSSPTPAGRGPVGQLTPVPPSPQ